MVWYLCLLTNTLRSILCFHPTSSKGLQNKLDFFDKFLARASNATCFDLVNTFCERGESLLAVLYRVDKFHLRTDVCILDKHLAFWASNIQLFCLPNIESNAFYHKETVKTKQIVGNGGDSILIFSYLLITKAMCIAYYFACDVRVMNDEATKQKVFDSGENFFCHKWFYLESFGGKSITWKQTNAINFASLTSLLFSEPLFLTYVFSILGKSSWYFSVVEIGIDCLSSSWSKIFLINACSFWTAKSR